MNDNLISREKFISNRLILEQKGSGKTQKSTKSRKLFRSNRRKTKDKNSLLPQLRILNLPSSTTRTPKLTKSKKGQVLSSEKRKFSKEFKKKIDSISKLNKIKISEVIKSNYLYLGSLNSKSEISLTKCLFDLEANEKIKMLEEGSTTSRREQIMMKNSKKKNRAKQFNLVYRNVYPSSGELKKEINIAHKKREFFAIHSYSRSKGRKAESFRADLGPRRKELPPDYVKRAIMDPKVTEQILQRYKTTRYKLRKSMAKGDGSGVNLFNELEISQMKSKKSQSCLKRDSSESDITKENCKEPLEMKELENDRKVRIFRKRKTDNFKAKLESMKPSSGLNSPQLFKIKDLTKGAFLRKKKIRRSSSLALFKNQKRQMKDRSEMCSNKRKCDQNDQKKPCIKISEIFKDLNIGYKKRSDNPWNMYYEGDKHCYEYDDGGGFGLDEYVQRM